MVHGSQQARPEQFELGGRKRVSDGDALPREALRIRPAQAVVLPSIPATGPFLFIGGFQDEKRLFILYHFPLVAGIIAGISFILRLVLCHPGSDFNRLP